VANSDTAARICPKGGTWTENTALFDGAVLYDPGHFGGMFSVFPDVPRWGEDTDTGPVPIGRSVVGLTTFGWTLASAGQKGEFSWDLGGRQTWIRQSLSVARELGLSQDRLDYGINDWMGGLAWGRSGDTLRASIYKSRDNLSTGPYSFNWGNLAVPLNVRWKLGDRLTFSGTGSYSKFDQTAGFDPILNLYNSVGIWDGHGDVRYDAGSGHCVSLGTGYDAFRVNITQSSPVEDVTTADITRSDLWAEWLQDDWTINSQQTITAMLKAYWYGKTRNTAVDPHISYTWRPNEDWALDARAGRTTRYLTILRSGDFEAPGDFWYVDRKPMAPSLEDRASLGVERRHLGPWNLRVGVEILFEKVRNQPMYFPSNTSYGGQTLGNAGLDPFVRNFVWLDGHSSGGEMSVGKDGGIWTGNVIYAYSESVLLQQPYNNPLGTFNFAPYPTPISRRNAVQVVGTLNWVGPRAVDAIATAELPWGNYFRSCAQLTAYTRPQRMLDPTWESLDGSRDLLGDEGPILFSEPEWNKAKPAFFQLDVTPIDWGRAGHWRFFFTVVNVTDHRNLWLRNLDTRTNPPAQDNTYSLARFPLLLGYQRWF
jgi:hypothetical protein